VLLPDVADAARAAIRSAPANRLRASMPGTARGGEGEARVSDAASAALVTRSAFGCESGCLVSGRAMTVIIAQPFHPRSGPVGPVDNPPIPTALNTGARPVASPSHVACAACRSWKTNVADLAVEVSPEVIDELEAAYAIIALWNVDLSTEAGKTAKGPIDANRADLRDQSSRLHPAAKHIPRFRPSPSLRVSCLLALVLVILASTVAAGLVIFVQRAKLTDATVAATLQSKLGGGALVDCSKNGNAWSCLATYPSRARSRCDGLAAERTPAKRVAVASLAPAFFSASQAACPSQEASRGEIATFEVAPGGSEGSAALVATRSSSDVERGDHAQAIPLTGSKKSYFQRAIDWILHGQG
jgi:hypothetical protein